MNQTYLLLIVVLEAIAIYFAWRAISSTRTPQGAIGWVIFLIAVPYIGVFLYLFLGHHKHRTYEVARRKSFDVVQAVREFGATHAPETPPEVNPKSFEKIADLPVVRGNDIALLVDGQTTFDAIFAAIDKAEQYVLVQFYIVHDDDLGRALKARLLEAAKRGVTVRFFVDAVGSHALPQAYYDELSKAGAIVIDPSQSRGPKTRFHINFRNHRKTVIVDGQIGFTGGFNVGDEYMGRDPKFGNWRDTHIEMRGPIVSQLQLVFAEDWHWAIGEDLLDDLIWETPYAPANKTALVVPTGPGDYQDTGALFFFAAIAAARERVWIASPYCVLDTDVLTALKHAALGGLDVRLLVPEVIDHTVPWLAAFAYFDELREAGVQIWRYDNGFMHQKAVLIDDTLSAIGTTNLDNRSFRLNFETMVLAFDQETALAVEAMLRADFDDARLLDKWLSEQTPRIRIGAPIARLFAPVL